MPGAELRRRQLFRQFLCGAIVADYRAQRTTLPQRVEVHLFDDGNRYVWVAFEDACALQRILIGVAFLGA